MKSGKKQKLKKDQISYNPANPASAGHQSSSVNNNTYNQSMVLVMNNHVMSKRKQNPLGKPKRGGSQAPSGYKLPPRNEFYF